MIDLTRTEIAVWTSALVPKRDRRTSPFTFFLTVLDKFRTAFIRFAPHF